MVSMAKIGKLGRQIGLEFRPEKVLLFGSHARRKPRADSDVDLLVIMPTEGKSIHQAVEIRLSLDHDIPIDVLVRTPEELGKRLAMGDSFLREILEKGVILYERDRR